MGKTNVAAQARILDDELLFISESGMVLSKAQVLVPFQAQEWNVDTRIGGATGRCSRRLR